MHQVLLILLLLPTLPAAVLSLSPEHLSSPLFLLPTDTACAINIGKDRTYGPLHKPEFVFYDGVRCKGQFSENASTAFVVGESSTLRDAADAARGIADVVALKAQVLETGLRHDRLGKVRRRNGVVQCGERELREVLFLGATQNGVVNVRGGRFRVQKGGLYAFVDDVNHKRQHGRGRHTRQLRAIRQAGLCFFKGRISNDGVELEGGGGDRAGIIAVGILGVAILAVLLYGVVFVLFRKVREGENGEGVVTQ